MNSPPPEQPVKQPPRPPAQPDRRAVVGDEQPAREAVRHPGLDGAEQPRPARVGTLPGMPALKRGPAPLELAATKPAPPNPLRYETWRIPTPPSTVALARRSDPPPAVPVETLPAATDSADGATQQRLRRRAEEAEARVAELERRARVRAETAAANFPPPVSQPAPRAPAPPAVPGSLPPTGWSDPRVIKVFMGLGAALTAAATPLGIWLTAKATALESAQERQDKRAQEATVTASSAKEQSRDVAKELDEMKKLWAAERSYNREVLRRLGVSVPKRPGDPEPPTLETQTPLRKPGAVSPAPVLVVTTPPP